MKNLIIYALSGISVIACIFWINNSRNYQKKIALLEEVNSTCQQKVDQQQKLSISLNDFYLMAQKNKTLAKFNASPLYFTANAVKNNNQWKISIYLQGDGLAAADAADLRLDFGNNLKVTEIKTGTSFPLYPRKVTGDDYLLITGLASLANNNVVFGQPGKLFADITIEASETASNQKYSLSLNKSDTKIYLNGESVFDDKKTFSQIVLP